MARICCRILQTRRPYIADMHKHAGSLSAGLIDCTVECASAVKLQEALWPSMLTMARLTCINGRFSSSAQQSY